MLLDLELIEYSMARLYFTVQVVFIIILRAEYPGIMLKEHYTA